MIKKLRFHFILINMILVSSVIIIMFVSLAISTANNIANSSYDFLEASRKRQLPIIEEKMFDKELADEILPGNAFFIRVNTDGVVLINENQTINFTETQLSLIIDQIVSSNNSKGTLKEYDLRYRLFEQPDNSIEIGFIDTNYETSILYPQLLSYLFIGLGSILVFFFISYYVSKLLIKPVEKSFTQQQQFVSDASHELKTPLTVILANASLMKKSKDTAVVDRSIDYIDTEAKRMKKLVEDLLFLARLDEQDNQIVFNRINYSDLTLESILPFEAVAFESAIEIKNDIQNNIFVKGNAMQLKQLIMIFLDNANKYSDKNTTIKISLSSSNNKATLSIKNYGIPISQDEIENIFNRFYRVNKARERESGSYGLGLSMAQKIVTSHKGTIAVNSSKKEGTQFIITLPTVN